MLLTLIGVRLIMVTSWRRLSYKNEYAMPLFYRNHQLQLQERVINESPTLYTCATSSTKQVVTDIVRIVSAHPIVGDWIRREETMLKQEEVDPRYNPQVPICIDSEQLQVRL